MFFWHIENTLYVILALREFVSINKERDVVTEYINSGGSAKEIIELLKIFNGKEDLTAANTIFSALYCLIVKYVNKIRYNYKILNLFFHDIYIFDF